MYDLVIYVAGPETNRYIKDDLEFLTHYSAKIEQIGNGDMDLVSDEHNIITDKLNQLKETYGNMHSINKVLVYISTHGTASDGKHYMITNNNLFSNSQPCEPQILYYTKEFFQHLKTTLEKPLDIIFLPCAAEYALTDVQYLPVGSKMIISEHIMEFSYRLTTQSILNRAIPTDDFNIEVYYDNFFFSLGSFVKPKIVISGGNIIDPVQSSHKYIGKVISPKARSYVHDHYAKNVCTSNEICYKHIENVIDKMEHATDLSQFVINNKEKTLKELNLIDDLIFELPQYKNDNITNAELSAFKQKADQLLLKNNIPLEIDLDVETWSQEIDTSMWNTEEKRVLLKEEQQAFYNILSEQLPERTHIERLCVLYGFKIVDNYNLPGYPDYGHVLGIVKDLEIFFNSHDL